MNVSQQYSILIIPVFSFKRIAKNYKVTSEEMLQVGKEFKMINLGQCQIYFKPALLKKNAKYLQLSPEVFFQSFQKLPYPL